ncbi:MAG: DUF192 domain-containing protein, partial [Candidatus Margulisbacteria bacterium]|nr:DUF192 domain-containing protein [Candidatus Margulisiibacteriota bacterium]
MNPRFYSIFIVGVLMGTALISPQSTQSKYTKAQIGNKTYKLEVAKTLEEKAKGLSGRKSLAKDQGMIFV